MILNEAMAVLSLCSCSHLAESRESFNIPTDSVCRSQGRGLPRSKDEPQVGCAGTTFVDCNLGVEDRPNRHRLSGYEKTVSQIGTV